MIHATSQAVLIAWDMGLGPTFRADGTRAHDLYRVYRATGGSTFLAAIGDTHAEAFYDTSVRRGAVYHYRVTAVAEDGSESPVGPTFTVHVPRVPPADRVAPTVPEKLTTTGWTPSSDSGSGVLAYFVERDAGPQPWAVLWNADGTLHEWTDESSVKEPYRLRALDGALNLSGASDVVAQDWGWFIRFEFMVEQTNSDDHTSQFEVVPYLGNHSMPGFDFNITPNRWVTFFTPISSDAFDGTPYNGVSIQVWWDGSHNGPVCHLRKTRVDFGLPTEDPGYFDGDSDGWEWDGPAHNSASRLTGGAVDGPRNLFVNPTFHENTSDGWYSHGEGYTVTLETNAMRLEVANFTWDPPPDPPNTHSTSDPVPICFPKAPIIFSFSPSSGPPGTEVVITGTDFPAVSEWGGFEVWIAGWFCEVITMDSSTQMTATVNAAAEPGTGRITAGDWCSSLTDFEVTPPP